MTTGIHQQVFYLDTALAFCFSCSYTLDVTGFYAKHREIPRQEAERELTKLFGGVEPQRQVDRVSMARYRVRGESLLKELRHPKLDLQIHAWLGEQLDRLLLFFERGHLDETGLDNGLGLWYNKVQEATRGLDPRRTPTANPDAGIPKRVGEIPQPGPEEGGVDLD